MDLFSGLSFNAPSSTSSATRSLSTSSPLDASTVSLFASMTLAPSASTPSNSSSSADGSTSSTGSAEGNHVAVHMSTSHSATSPTRLRGQSVSDALVTDEPVTMPVADTAAFSFEARMQTLFNSAATKVCMASSSRQREMDIAETLKRLAVEIESDSKAQAAAIESEDYDLADQLNGTLEGKKAEVEKLRSAAAEIANKASTSTSCASSSSSASPSASAVVDSIALTELKDTLQDLASTIEADMQEAASNAKRVRQTTRNRLDKENELHAAEADRIGVLVKHQNADLTRLEEEVSEIRAQEDTETKEEQARRANLVTEQVKLLNEIASLEAQLKRKQQELADNNEALDLSSNKLQLVHTGYEKKLKRVAERKADLLSDTQETNKEAEALELKRAQLRADEAELAAKTRRVELDACRSKRVTTVAQASSARFTELVATLDEWTKKLGNQSDEVGNATSAILDAEQAIATTEAEILSIRQQEAHHQGVIGEANNRIPTLTAEKKLAVTAKNFKAAGALTKDIAQLQENKTASEQELARLQTAADECIKKAAELESQRTKCAEALAAAEIARDRRLADGHVAVAKSMWELAKTAARQARRVSTQAALAAGENEVLDSVLNEVVTASTGLNSLSHNLGPDSIKRPFEPVTVQAKWYSSDASLCKLLEAEKDTLSTIAAQFCEEARLLSSKYGWPFDATPPSLDGDDEESDDDAEACSMYGATKGEEEGKAAGAGAGDTTSISTDATETASSSVTDVASTSTSEGEEAVATEALSSSAPDYASAAADDDDGSAANAEASEIATAVPSLPETSAAESNEGAATVAAAQEEEGSLSALLAIAEDDAGASADAAAPAPAAGESGDGAAGEAANQSSADDKSASADADADAAAVAAAAAKRAELESQIAELEAKASDLDGKVNDASEREDYDLAATLQSEVDAVNEEISKLKETLASIV